MFGLCLLQASNYRFGVHRSCLTERPDWSGKVHPDAPGYLTEAVLKESWARNGREGRQIDPLTGARPDGSSPTHFVLWVEGKAVTSSHFFGCTATNCLRGYRDPRVLIKHWAAAHSANQPMAVCGVCRQQVTGVGYITHLQEHELGRARTEAVRAATEGQVSRRRREDAGWREPGSGPHHDFVAPRGWNRPWFTRVEMEQRVGVEKLRNPFRNVHVKYEVLPTKRGAEEEAPTPPPTARARPAANPTEEAISSKLQKLATEMRKMELENAKLKAKLRAAEEEVQEQRLRRWAAEERSQVARRAARAGPASSSSESPIALPEDYDGCDPLHLSDESWTGPTLE